MKKSFCLIVISFSVVIIAFIISCKNKASDTKEIKISNSDTLPLSKKEKALNFMVIGDWGRNGDYNQCDVANQMNYYAHEYDVKFVISTGDNFYINGVRSIDDPQWIYSFENVYHGGSLQTDWYIALGNHDYRGSVQAEIDYTKKSRRWNMPARYFSIKEKIDKNDTACFVFYDSSPFISSYYKDGSPYNGVIGQDTIKQLKWLDSILYNTKTQWKFVVGHHPIFSGSVKHGTTPELNTYIKPILEKDNVQAYFSGHEHSLQHIKPYGSKIDYFISGAGSQTEEIGDVNGICLFNYPKPGFEFVSLTTDSLKSFFINHEGKVLYKYSRARWDN